SAPSSASEVGKIVVINLVVLTNDPHSARLRFGAAKEIVALDHTAIAVSQSQGAHALGKCVVTVNVLTGFVGDNLHVPIALLEEIVLHHRAREVHGHFAGPDSDGLATVDTQRGPRPEVIVVDAMVVGPVRLAVHPNDDRAAQIPFAFEVAMVEPVADAVEGNPFGVVL